MRQSAFGFGRCAAMYSSNFSISGLMASIVSPVVQSSAVAPTMYTSRTHGANVNLADVIIAGSGEFHAALRASMTSIVPAARVLALELVLRPIWQRRRIASPRDLIRFAKLQSSIAFNSSSDIMIGTRWSFSSPVGFFFGAMEMFYTAWIGCTTFRLQGYQRKVNDMLCNLFNIRNARRMRCKEKPRKPVFH